MGLFQGRFARVAVRPVAAAAVSLAVIGAAASAQASVIFDFVGIVAVVGEGPFDNSAPYTIDIGSGIKVQAFGSGPAGSQAYLDAVSGGLDGGLGVCHNFTTATPPQCTPSSEDNVTSGETLTLQFSDTTEAMNLITVLLNPTFFRNADHGDTFDGKISIQIDGMGFALFDLTNIFTTPLTGSTFDFKYYNNEFYISSVAVTQVPLPAALPLFLSALAGLAFVGRRRGRRAAA